MKTSSPNYVRIFDTSLRDGEQAPGASMTSAEKLEVARSLARLGVDVIEAGFPAASPDDLAAVQAIAAEIGQAPSFGSYDLGLRFQHLSNGGLRNPNPGINLVILRLQYHQR